MKMTSFVLFSLFGEAISLSFNNPFYGPLPKSILERIEQRKNKKSIFSPLCLIQESSSVYRYNNTYYFFSFKKLLSESTLTIKKRKKEPIHLKQRITPTIEQNSVYLYPNVLLLSKQFYFKNSQENSLSHAHNIHFKWNKKDKIFIKKIAIDLYSNPSHRIFYGICFLNNFFISQRD